MPPWHIDRTVGIKRYINDRSLTDEEIATIVAWVDDGAPRGNPSDLPPPATFAADDEWYIGAPDLIVTMEQDMVVAAEGPDTFFNVFAKTGLTEDRYIRAIEVHPGDRRVVHHVNTFAVQGTGGIRSQRAGWLHGRGDARRNLAKGNLDRQQR